MTERAVRNGLLHERATPAYEAPYEHAWQRDRETWRAVHAALDAADGGAVPAAPRETPPRWLAPLARRLLVEASTRSWAGGHFAEVRRLERLGLVAPDHDETYVLALVSAGPAAADADVLGGLVWRVFEVEGGGEVSLANRDKFTAPTWQDAFLGWVADGTLPRARVLAACLAALARDFGAYRAGWYLRLYEALVPAPDEQDQAALRALLRSPVGPTVSTAVRRLRALGKAGLLDDAATAAALRPALLAKTKGTAVEAVRLLDDAARRGVAVAAYVADALDNPNADVQRAAVTVLTRLGAADLAVARAADLEPSVAASLGVAAGPASAAAPTAGPVALPAGPAVVPVSDDLLERLAALLEDARDPAEVEAVLAALAALGDPEPLRPLRKRAATVAARGPRDDVTPGWLRGHLARLVLVALGEPADPVPVAPGTEFLVARLAEVERALTDRAPFAMLATPDDGWWVRPETLLARLGPGARHHDVVAALLRLAPDGRVPGGTGPVAYALGGAAPTPAQVRADAARWVAAARARDPLGEDAPLAAAGLTGAGRALPLRAYVTTAPASFTSGGQTRTYERWSVVVPDAVTGAPADQPTAVAASDAGWGTEYEDWTGWLATVWPHDAEHFLVRGAESVLWAADSTMVRHDAPRVLDALAAHPGRLGPLAYATVAAALASGRADHRVRAADLALTRPLSAADLAGGVVALHRVLPAARWARGLGDVAAGGGGAFVLDVLDAALPRLPNDLRGAGALVGLLREESLRHARPPGPALRGWLAAFTGSSKTAVAARALLAEC